ncbi:chromate transporter [Bacillus fonticola]|uniref:chromate transporter n=1 Tax=Bacillus fonticola TaxID=2728853 RepID=UPI0014757D61|nr:chromate transporter [Bacillus fonticola]
MTVWHLFLAFFRVGIFGFGGGPSSIPLVHKEVVERYEWLSDEEFSDVLALGNALPGPIATKLAGYIGFRVSGVFGCLAALIATAFPTVIAMIALLQVLNTFKDERWVQGMTAAVVPVVAVMLAVLTWDFVKKSTSGIGVKMTVAFLAGSTILLQLIGLHPAILIFAVLLSALLFTPAAEKGTGEVRKERAG